MTDDIRISREGAWGIITLSRPKALNSLNVEMCIAIDEALAEWAGDGAVAAVLVEGEGDRAFCAGGDIRKIYEVGPENPVAAAGFFRREYRMNARIAAFGKPYVAMMDGVCMGGGVGISMMASHRVVTDRTLWAMPECMIGLAPDVGASYFLNNMQGALGPYLGLTGTRLDGPACLLAGIGTHLTNAERMTALRADLIASDANGIDAVLERYADAIPSPLADSLPAIDTLFGGVESVEELVERLKAAGAEGEAALQMIEPASPTSLKLTLALLNGAPSTFNECIAREFCVMANLLHGHDLYEGVRAQIIDKDRTPKWHPATLPEVSDTEVSRYFEIPEGGPLDLSGL